MVNWPGSWLIRTLKSPFYTMIAKIPKRSIKKIKSVD
jgi:hypothetical protein